MPLDVATILKKVAENKSEERQLIELLTMLYPLTHRAASSILHTVQPDALNTHRHQMPSRIRTHINHCKTNGNPVYKSDTSLKLTNSLNVIFGERSGEL